MYGSLSDPLLADYLGITPNTDGSVTSHATGFTTFPGTDLAAIDAAAPAAAIVADNSSPGACPSWWPAWGCAIVNAVPGSAQAGQAGNAAGKQITGKDNATTGDVAKALTPTVQAIATVIGAVLIAVVLIALGVWTIVRD